VGIEGASAEDTGTLIPVKIKRNVIRLERSRKGFSVKNSLRKTLLDLIMEKYGASTHTAQLENHKIEFGGDLVPANSKTYTVYTQKRSDKLYQPTNSKSPVTARSVHTILMFHPYVLNKEFSK